jgi:hypothetical protein
MNLPPSGQNNQSVQLPNFVKNATESLGNAVSDVGKTYGDIKSNVNTSLSGFSQQASAGVGASQQFLTSNTIVAKFAFVILIIILFIFFLGLGVNLIQYFINPANNPYLIKGMISGSDSQIITQDPSRKGAISIRRSNNQRTGLEFTWSVWLYIADLKNGSTTATTNAQGVTTTSTSLPTTYQHVFSKGDAAFGSNGIATVNNGPGLYIAPGTNTLHIIMNTTGPNNSSDAIVDISNVPIKKWVHVAIRMENTMMDVYINGVIAERLVLQYVPKQNYSDVLVCQNGGFNGNLSNLRYYDKALSVIQITNIVYWGPNTSASSSTGTTKGGFEYLSSTWYTGLSL